MPWPDIRNMDRTHMHKSWKSSNIVQTLSLRNTYEEHIFPADQTCIDWFALDFFALIKEVDYWVDGPAPIISELVSY